MRDLATDRADGLGWYFGLFFLVHALAPGIGATVCALTLGGKYALPLAALSVVAYAPAWLVVRGALKKKRRIERNQEIEATGERAWADVLGVERLLGSTRSGWTRYGRAAARLMVRPHFGAPFEATTTAWYRTHELARLVPGSRVLVAYSRDTEREVLVVDVPDVRVAPHALSPGAAMAPVIPASIKRGQLVGLPLLVLIPLGLGPVALVIGITADDEESKQARAFFADLRDEDYESAYARLEKDLQRSLGSPEGLGAVWEQSRMAVGDLTWGCSSGGGGSWVLGYSAPVTRVTGSAPTFHLGQVRSAKCSRQVTVEVVDEGGKPRIRGFRIR